MLNLDDFYKDGDDPTLPCLDLGGGPAIVDWDDPGPGTSTTRSTRSSGSAPTRRPTCPSTTSRSSRRTGRRPLDLAGATHFVAEGIFAQEVVGACVARGVLADAICLTQHPAVTFVRRLTRDLREHRKPPAILVRRGLHLLREQRAVVERAAALGCRVLHPEQAYAEIRALLAG